MALGLEQAIAEFLNAPPGPVASFGGLYDDADPAERVIFVQEEPPVPTDDVPSTTEITTAELTITVFTNSGSEPQLLIGETWSMVIVVRHPRYEVAMETQRRIYDLLQENGGQSNGANPLAQGLFRGIKIWRITADFAPVLLGRDRDGRDGRYRTTQTFTVRTKPFLFS